MNLLGINFNSTAEIKFNLAHFYFKAIHQNMGKTFLIVKVGILVGTVYKSLKK